MISEKLKNMMLAHLDGIYKFSARKDCDELVTEIINENVILHDALYPRPEIKDTSPLVLYFSTKQERGEFIELIHECKPGMRSYSV